jgi:hypothetical protein
MTFPENVQTPPEATNTSMISSLASAGSQNRAGPPSVAFAVPETPLMMQSPLTSSSNHFNPQNVPGLSGNIF